MFLHSDRLELLQLVLVVQLPLVVAFLLHLATAVLQAVSSDPFSEVEDALQRLLQVFSSGIILKNAAKEVIHVEAKDGDQLSFKFSFCRWCWRFVKDQEAACIKRMLHDLALASFQDSF